MRKVPPPSPKPLFDIGCASVQRSALCSTLCVIRLLPAAPLWPSAPPWPGHAGSHHSGPGGDAAAAAEAAPGARPPA